MATYNVEKLTKLGALKQLAERIRDDYATKEELSGVSGTVGTVSNKVETLEKTVQDIVTTGGEKNVIVDVKVNGTSVRVGEDRSVDINVPTDNNQLANGAGYQTASDVTSAVTSGINDWANKITENDVIDTFKEVTEYLATHKNVADQLVADAAKAKTDIAKNESAIDALETLVGDTSVEDQITSALTGYVQEDTLEDYVQNSTLENYVQNSDLEGYVQDSDLEGYVKKENGKALSTNDYTAADKAKVDALIYATDDEVDAMLDDVFSVE